MDFVKKVSQICRGKAYFATTLNLANYIFMDFMTKKTKTDNVSLKVEQLENRDAPSMPPAVMRRLDDLGRGNGDIIIREPGGGLE
jgi:hypothetical protein